MTKQKNPKQSQKQNKLATVYFTSYYPSANLTFTNNAKALNIMFPATQNDQAKNARKKAKNKTL